MAHPHDVILEKVTRRHTFILGRSTVLESSSVVLLEGGGVALQYVRRDGVTGLNRFPYLTFAELVEGKRKFEREYLTGEIPG
jgi:hypothetical protein